MKKQKKNISASQMSMQEIYDLLMFDIEPDLMLDQVGDLDELYMDETEGEHKERMERYQESFKEFFERFDKILGAWKGELGALKTEMITKLQEKVAKGKPKKNSDKSS